MFLVANKISMAVALSELDDSFPTMHGGQLLRQIQVQLDKMHMFLLCNQRLLIP